MASTDPDHSALPALHGASVGYPAVVDNDFTS